MSAVRTPLLSLVLLAGTVLPATAEPVAFKDMTGRDVKLDRPAERIVMIPIPTASTVIALDGGTSRLAGIHPLAKSAIEEAILGVFFPEAKAVPSNILTDGGSEGFAPNVEAIAALRPDLVVQWGNQGEDLVKPLTNAGMNTALIVYGKEGQARDFIGMIGTAIARTDKLKELIAWREASAAAIEAKIKDVPASKRPKVLYLLRTEGEFRVQASGSFNDFYIKLAGGVNAAAELSGAKPVNREQIAVWNPDFILINGFESDASPDVVYKDPVLSATSAGQKRQVYKMPIGGYRWDPPSQESPLTWMWLAELLHPDLFDFELRGDIKAWYRKLYGHVPTDAQIDDILRMKMNGVSAHYGVMAKK